MVRRVRALERVSFWVGSAAAAVADDDSVDDDVVDSVSSSSFSFSKESHNRLGNLILLP